MRWNAVSMQKIQKHSYHLQVKLHTCTPPGGLGVRWDSHVYAGYTVPPHYDSMIAKLITYGDTRDVAIRRMQNALSETIIDGIKTNIPLHELILEDENFQKVVQISTI